MVARRARHINNRNEMCRPTVFLMDCVINFKHWVLLSMFTDYGKGKLRCFKQDKHPVTDMTFHARTFYIIREMSAFICVTNIKSVRLLRRYRHERCDSLI